MKERLAMIRRFRKGHNILDQFNNMSKDWNNMLLRIALDEREQLEKRYIIASWLRKREIKVHALDFS